MSSRAEIAAHGHRTRPPPQASWAIPVARIMQTASSTRTSLLAIVTIAVVRILLDRLKWASPRPRLRRCSVLPFIPDRVPVGVECVRDRRGAAARQPRALEKRHPGGTRRRVRVARRILGCGQITLKVNIVAPTWLRPTAAASGLRRRDGANGVHTRAHRSSSRTTRSMRCCSPGRSRTSRPSLVRRGGLSDWPPPSKRAGRAGTLPGIISNGSALNRACEAAAAGKLSGGMRQRSRMMP